ncbi:MAG TPA: PQQ-binding-like beta-propeller repeat protein [Pirellulales bacterium]|nr:PQQ-binding-like beta-propeller repeat protein [Pirellulales bacterium]
MNEACSMGRLESALAGGLSADDEASLHQHLEQCTACADALDQMAGGPAWAQEAAALLTRDGFDESLSAGEDWSAVDFTVDHLDPSDEPGVLGRLGGYDVLGIVGHGGMGVVLKAYDRDLKRAVAIKVLAPHLARSSLARKRFAREAQAAAAVVHPHVLAIHQVQPSGRLPFLVMPLVAGESLAQRLGVQGALELKEILRIGMQAAAGLAAAHEQGLVHRDVKPANILLEKNVERAVLTDFGLARAADDAALTRWGVIAGTPEYMSPEQARGEPLDCRSDQFGLGCVLYEMATGVSPFRAETVMATMRRLVDDQPQPLASLNPDLPRWLIGIVERLLAKEPDQRFGSAKEVSALLESCLAHVQQPSTVPLPSAVLRGTDRPRSRHRPWRYVVAAGTLAVGLLAAALAATQPPDIAGQWRGDDWGEVILTRSDDGVYSGTYSETLGEHPGRIQLEWSRLERRFKGTWRDSDDRFGELSLRLVGAELHGAQTNAGARVDAVKPRLADLTWVRREQRQNLAKEGDKPIASPGMIVRGFRLRFRLASEMAEDLQQILSKKAGHVAQASADNQEIVVTAPADVMKRVETFVTILDWPDGITRGNDFQYPHDTVVRAARSFFYACAIEDAPEAFSKMLTPGVLAELKGDTRSKEYRDYLVGGTPDADWEQSLRSDWPGKKERLELLVREWNRFPLKRITEGDGVAIGFGVKYSCSLSFGGAPQDFYSVSIEPDRAASDRPSLQFGSLPPWWPTEPSGASDVLPPSAANAEGAVAASGPPANPNTEPAAPNGEIRGQLVDDVTGRPVARALIACSPFINDWLDENTTIVATGGDGCYRIRVPSPGIYNVWLQDAQDDAHMTAVDDDGVVVEPYKVAESNLRLVRARMVAGKVIGADGKPVAGCDVIATSSRRSEPQIAKTESNGSFRLAMPPGRAYIYTYSPTNASDPASLDARTFASAALELPAAGDGPTTVTLKLRPQSQDPVEWLLHSSPGTGIVGRTDATSVAGIVDDAAGAPVRGAKVFDRDGPIIVTDEQGKFRIECEEKGPITLHVFRPGFHVWTGEPTPGDVVHIVLESKPVEKNVAEVTPVPTGAVQLVQNSQVPPRADDWRTFRGDAAGTGVASTTLPAKPLLLWKKQLAGKCAIEGTAAIVDNTIYVADLGGNVIALRLADGEQLWQFTGGSGFRASPAVRDGVLYIGDVAGKFHALDVGDGHEKWSRASEAEITAGANFYGERVLFTSQDGGLYCLNSSNGEVVWTYKIDEPIQSSPSVAGHHCLLTACDGKLHLVDLDSGRCPHSIDIDEPGMATSAISGDFAYWTTPGGHLLSVYWPTMRIEWMSGPREGRSISSSAALGERLVVCAGLNGIYAFRRDDGEQVWNRRLRDGVTMSSPVVVGRHVFVAASNGRLYSFDLAIGDNLWEYDAGGHFLASPAIAQGRLVIGNDAGELFCFGRRP